MGMVLKNNMGAVRTLNVLEKNNKKLKKSLSKVSSGMKIEDADDDSANWGISERMRVRIRALEQANQNAQNDSSLMKTAEGAVDNTIDILKELKAKAIDAANDSNTDEDRQTIQKEVNQLVDQINDNALVTFNGKYMLTGIASGGIQFKKGFSQTCSRTVMVNQSLGTDNRMGSQLTALTNRAGDSLGIQKTDLWKVSWVVNGETHVESGHVSKLANLSRLILANESNPLPDPANPYYDQGTVGADGKLAGCYDRYGQQMYAPNNQPGLYIVAPPKADGATNSGGLDTALSGFTIDIMDAMGNSRQSANAALNAFKLLEAAENNYGEGGFTSLFNFQLGSEANQAMKIAFSDMRAHALGLTGNTGNVVSVTTKDNANAAISVFENALTMALDQQTNIGAILTRLEYTSTNILTSRDNDQASESTIRDADMAKEMTEYTKANVLLQAAQAMLAQANQNSSAVLSLLQ